MKKLFTIIAVAVMMFTGSVNNAMAQQPVASAPGVVGQQPVASAPGTVGQQPVASAPMQGDHHHHGGEAFLNRVANAIEHSNEHNTYGRYNPQTGMMHYIGHNITCDTRSTNCHVTRVDKFADKTVVHFLFVPNKDVQSYLVSNTTIQDNDSGMKYTMTASINLFTDRSMVLRAGQPFEFAMIFPAVSCNCHSIDVVENYPDQVFSFHVEGIHSNYDMN